MPIVATIEDVVEIAQQAVLEGGGSIYGITATIARYVRVPDETSNPYTNEWVTDVFILNGPSQNVVFSSADSGLARINNVLINHDASGNIVADLNVPVELRWVHSGQLQIMGRAKVHLPTVHLDGYNLADLKVTHTAELEYDDVDGVFRDPFGFICNINTGRPGGTATTVSGSHTQTTRLSTFKELDEDDAGNDILLEVNLFQRTIAVVMSTWLVLSGESISIGETIIVEKTTT